MARFLEGFRKGLKQGSYRMAALPSLDFADGGFDLTFYSHLLFLYRWRPRFQNPHPRGSRT